MENGKTIGETRKQAIYAFVRAYILENGYSPTVREIGESVGLRSTSSVQRYVEELVQEGRLRHKKSGPRTIVAIEQP